MEGKEARAAEDDDGGTKTFELEAAEAPAGLGRRSESVAASSSHPSQEMEQTMVKYNSLKERNKFLKAQKAELEDTQGEPKSNYPPSFLYNQPSLVPCFWPSIHPSSSDVYQFNCASHPNGSSQFLVPDQGQENSMPIFLAPIPWMFPVLTHTNNIMPMQQFSNSSSFSSSDTMPHHHNDNDFAISGVESDSVSAIEHTTRNALKNDREPFIGPKKQEDAFGATEARRKRKELMKMKDIH